MEISSQTDNQKQRKNVLTNVKLHSEKIGGKSQNLSFNLILEQVKVDQEIR